MTSPAAHCSAVQLNLRANLIQAQTEPAEPGSLEPVSFKPEEVQHRDR